MSTTRSCFRYRLTPLHLHHKQPSSSKGQEDASSGDSAESGTRTRCQQVPDVGKKLLGIPLLSLRQLKLLPVAALTQPVYYQEHWLAARRAERPCRSFPGVKGVCCVFVHGDNHLSRYRRASIGRIASPLTVIEDLSLLIPGFLSP